MNSKQLSFGTAGLLLTSPMANQLFSIYNSMVSIFPSTFKKVFTNMKQDFKALITDIRVVSVTSIPGGGYRFGGTEENPNGAVLSLVPCTNYRTKTLVAFVCSGVELQLLTVVIPRDVGAIKDEEKGHLMVALNKQLAEFGCKVAVMSTNGVHMERVGAVTNFCMGKTHIVSFKEYTHTSNADGRKVFNVAYRQSMYDVSSEYFTPTRSLDSIYGLINSLLPNVYAG